MPSLGIIDRKRHPDGVHRNQYGHALYSVPGEAGDALCSLCRQRVDGFPYQRTTTFIDVLEARFQLEKWQQRQVIRGLVLKEHLQVKAAGVFDSDSALDDIAQDAFQAADSAQGRDMGTGVHGTTEQVDRGDSDVVIHPSIKDTIAAYRQLLDAHRLTVQEIECHVCLDGVTTAKTTRGISGTFDRIVTLPEWCPVCGTNRRVLDLKTTKPTSFTFDFRKIPMQLAAYARGNGYNTETGERSPLNVCQCTGLVVHLPLTEDRKYLADLYTADLDAGRRGLNIAYQVWEWRRSNGLMKQIPDPGSSGASGQAGGALDEPDIHGLIAMAGDRNSIIAIWEQAKEAGKWAYGHELAARRRIEELESKQAIELEGTKS